MDPRLLRYYNQELQHLREMGAEFAQQFPKIAARLRMDGIEVGDPYVERLLEGFAFLASRVQLKLDAEFPRFTERLLEIVYPNYLSPTPSMMVAQLQPTLGDAALATGPRCPAAASCAVGPSAGRTPNAGSAPRTTSSCGRWRSRRSRTSRMPPTCPWPGVHPSGANTAAACASG
jgi:type VI secretion system protein ImpG